MLRARVSLCVCLSFSLSGTGSTRGKGHVSPHDEEVGLEPWELRRAAQLLARCDVGRVTELREARSPQSPTAPCGG